MGEWSTNAFSKDKKKILWRKPVHTLFDTKGSTLHL